MHFSPAEVPSAPRHPDSVTHEHGNTVTALVVSMYVCFVVTVSSDLVLDRAEQTVWEVGFVLVRKCDTRLHSSFVIGGMGSPLSCR